MTHTESAAGVPRAIVAVAGTADVKVLPPCGDLDGDGRIADRDVTLAQQVVLGTIPVDPLADVAAPFGVFNTTDWLRILQSANGTPPPVECGTWPAP